ncbi:MAG: voltage-gated potassium channel [Methanobacteriota archaeon]|jgi:voltage-gated potassium channel
MKNHVVVLGYGSLTRPVLDKLGERTRYVVVATDPELADRLRDRGYDVVETEAVDEEALAEAGVRDARAVVVASENDADDALAILTVNQASPDVEVIAVASSSENAGKLRRAGADTVVSPADIVGKLLVESALTGKDTERIVEEMRDRIARR